MSHTEPAEHDPDDVVIDGGIPRRCPPRRAYLRHPLPPLIFLVIFSRT